MFASARVTALALAAALCAGACADYWKCESAACQQDADLRKEVRQQIDAHSSLKFFSIDVQTHDGAVYLQGMVDTEGDRQRAELIASAVPGVKRVYNALGLIGNGSF
jgi:osmotically-inducible protein OsmY